METRWGKRLGRYEIVAELGRGAMGSVYKARDPKIKRFVAIKTITLFGQNSDEARDYRERFFQEAQAAGRLFHPGIVTIFDVGEEPETRDPYIVMEYITGQPLSLRLSDTGKLPLDAALRLTEELAVTLDYAHAQGVVHRDIKPANILVTEEGHAKITDFGIAKMDLSHLTLPGWALGTPAYMSPEQLAGEPVDGRSDLFSLGVILYSMVTGHKPFQGNSTVTVCFKVVNRDPLPATALAAELPPEIDTIIARAMAKDPARRYQRGMQLAMDLRELREQHFSKNITKAGWPLGNRDNRAADKPKDASPGAAFDQSLPPEGTFQPDARLHLTASGNQATPNQRSPLLVIGVAALVMGLGWLGLSRARLASETATASLTNVPSGKIVPADAPATKPALNSQPPQAERRPHKAPAMSTLEIEIDHHFAAGTVWVWVDDKLAYSHELQGETRKHLVVLRGVQGHESGRAHVPAGEHRLQVRVQSKADAYDQYETIVGNFTKLESRTLRVTCAGRKRNMHLVLQ